MFAEGRTACAQPCNAHAQPSCHVATWCGSYHYPWAMSQDRSKNWLQKPTSSTLHLSLQKKCFKVRNFVIVMGHHITALEKKKNWDAPEKVRPRCSSVDSKNVCSW